MTYYYPDTSETRDPLIVSTVFGVLAFLSFIGRLYAIYLRNDRPKVEEWFIFAALCLTYVSLGLQWACVTLGGTGRHITDVEAIDPNSVILTLKLIIPFEALYGITIMLIKFGVLSFYGRMFALTSWFKLSLRITAATVFLWMASIVLETFLLCRPLAYNWDTSIEGVCGDRNAAYVIAGVMNMITDFMVLLLPVPAIWQLKMPTGQKVGLVGVFSMGVLITAISIVRLHSLITISFTDPTWTLPMGLLWTVLEPELAIINANLPFMRRFLAQIIPKAFSLSRSSRGYPTKGSRRVDFEQIPENGNGFMLRTIGGGFVHRSAAAVGTGNSQNPSTLQSFDGKGIVQERSVQVEFERASDEEMISKPGSAF